MNTNLTFGALVRRHAGSTLGLGQASVALLALAAAVVGPRKLAFGCAASRRLRVGRALSAATGLAEGWRGCARVLACVDAPRGLAGALRLAARGHGQQRRTRFALNET